MQELLGRIARLDASASLGLRVIACFDELIVGNVNTRALLSTAASLAGCNAGFRQIDPPRTLRITPKGEFAEPPDQTSTAWPTAEPTEGMTLWLERDGEPRANDAIILERLALAMRVRHGRGLREVDNRRHLGILTDQDLPREDRLQAGSALGLVATRRYRIVAAPLFAVWQNHPAGPEDVIGTRFGPIHAIVLPEHYEAFQATPCGIGTAASTEFLSHSFRTAMVALRLCSPPEEPYVLADAYGGLIELLAETRDDSHHSDANCLDTVVKHSWGLETVAAIVKTQTVREAARALGVHHSTLQSRLDTITAALGFNPNEGLGRSRLGTAYLVHRLRQSKVLEMPAPPLEPQRT